MQDATSKGTPARPPPPASYATDAVCFACGAAWGFDLALYLCPSCGERPHEADPGILDLRYDYDAIRATWNRAASDPTAGLWRYGPFLPVAPSGRPMLSTGLTPLVRADRIGRGHGLRALYLKDETRNPTRCLKDRATAVAIEIAVARGRTTVYCASAGNAAVSLAAQAAYAGLACHVFVPSYSSAARLDRLRGFGATVHVSAGDYDAAFREAEASAGDDWYSRNCAYNPFLVEGKKTVAFEIAEQLGWRAPDLVVAPVGDGCTLGAIGKGFRELLAVGAIPALPRLIGVQAGAVAPLVRRFRGEAAGDLSGTTRATSIAVRRPRNALRLLAEIERSGGTLLEVSDEETAAAVDRLGREAGVAAEFTSATTLAALTRLADAEPLAGRTAVLAITGGWTG